MTDEELRIGIANRDAAILRQYGPGSVDMERCILCGYMRFLCCRTSEPGAVNMRDMFSVSSCGRCSEIHQRAPEIFDWIVGVVQHLHTKGH